MRPAVATGRRALRLMGGRNDEHAHQVALVEWAMRWSAQIPELRLLFAIPNAGAGAQRGQAGKMRAEGVKAGVPDLCLPVARGGYHALYLEMKSATGRISQAQLDWHLSLQLQGARVEVCRSWDAARTVILEYLGVRA